MYGPAREAVTGGGVPGNAPAPYIQAMPNDNDPLSAVRPKLVESKKQWAREGRLLTGTIAEPTVRLPPGQREVKNWPVLDLGLQPDLPREQWKLTVDGMVEHPLVW